MVAGRWFSAIALAIALVGCSFDWDTYDPRLGDGDASAGSSGAAGSGFGGSATGGSSGSTGGTGASGGSSGIGGSSATGGSGGSAGSGGSSGSAGAGGTAGGAAGSSGSGGSAGASVLTATYTPPTVCDCINLNSPNPDTCQTESGNGVVSVDLQNSAFPYPDGGTAPPTAAFLSFALDNAFAGKQVLSVTLEMMVTSATNAASTNSGEVWEVAAFTRPDLFNAVPAKQGSLPLAPSQGAVTSLQVVKWPLPTTLVKAGQTLYLGLFPKTNDGVDYYSKVSPAPPKLIVTYQ